MSERFGRAYFDSQGYGTGRGDFYRDFPQHHKTASEVLKRKPESVLELGGARGYVCKILQANGVPATCMDISLHCWHTRAVKEFSLWDATEVPWGIATGIVKGRRFDLCFSIAFMEHIPEDKLEPMIKEMARVTKRGLHGITFTQAPSDHDETHATLKPKEWWEALFKRVAPEYAVEIVDKEDLERQPITLPQGDGLVKYNIGSFCDMYYYGWKNVDAIDLTEWAKFRGYEFIHADVRQGFKVQDNTVDIILASHFLEHLNREEGAKFLAECFRVLKPDGLIRIAVPDARLIAQEYSNGRIMEYRHVNIGVDNAPDEAEAFYHLLLAGHQTVYDAKSLVKALGKAGFSDVTVQKPFESASMVIRLQTISMYPTLSLYAEGRKRSSSSQDKAEPATTHVEIENGIQISRNGNGTFASPTHVEALKVALLSTPLLTVPPINYGGLEMIVADLGRELAKLGHDVTIFAPNGSKVEGCKVVETNPPSNTVFMDWLRAESDMLETIKDQLGAFDIVHGHNWFGMEYRAKALGIVKHACHTHHGGLVADWWTKNRAPFPLNMIAISNWMKSCYERQGIPTQTVHNGVNPEKYPLRKKKSDRFLFLGRIAFFKAPHLAIKIAKETGIKLDIVGATQFVEDAKYVQEIKNSCDGEQIRFIGEVSHEDKLEYLSNAKALIVPACWGEPFGLHVVEAMMVGTQVYAVADGGIKETVQHGGILCQDIWALKDAIQHHICIPPATCRRNAMVFSAKNMALGYEKKYRCILAGAEW